MKLKFSLLLLLLTALSTFTLTASSGSEVHDVAVVDVTVYPTKSLTASTVIINATVENQGNSYETFNVTTYFDNNTIQTLPITELEPGANTTLTFEWRIMDFRLLMFPWPRAQWFFNETYTISVEADQVPSEIDTSDNVYVDGTVRVVWLITDINGDGCVNIFDLANTTPYFGFYLGHPEWDPDRDVVEAYGVINIFDIAVVAADFGRCYDP